MSTEAEVIDEPPFLSMPSSNDQIHTSNSFLDNSLPANSTIPTTAHGFSQCGVVRNQMSTMKSPSDIEQVSNENTPFNGSSILRKLTQKKREQRGISEQMQVQDDDALKHNSAEDATTATVQHLNKKLTGSDLACEETYQASVVLKGASSSSDEGELHSSKSPQSKIVRFVHSTERSAENDNTIDDKREMYSFLTHPGAGEALGMKSPRGRHRTARSKPFRRSQTPFNRQLVRIESDDERDICLTKHKGSGASRACSVVPQAKLDPTVLSPPPEDPKAGISPAQRRVTFAQDALTCETKEVRAIGEHTSGGRSSDSFDSYPEEKSIRSLRSIRRGSVENFDALQRSSMVSPRGREREATIRHAKRSPTPFNRRVIKCYDGDGDDNRRAVQDPGTHETSSFVPFSYTGKKDTEVMASPRHHVKFAEGDVAVTSFKQAVSYERKRSSPCQESSAYEQSPVGELPSDHEGCLGDTNAEKSKNDEQMWSNSASGASPTRKCSCDRMSKHESRSPLNQQTSSGCTSEEEDYGALESLQSVLNSKPPRFAGKSNVTVERLYRQTPQDPGPGSNGCSSDRGSQASHEANCQSYKCCISNDWMCRSCVCTVVPQTASGFLYENREPSCISRDSDVDALYRSMSKVTAASSTTSVDNALSQKGMQISAKCEKATQTTVDYTSSSPPACHCEHMAIVEGVPTHPFVAVMNLVNRLINMFRF